MAIYVIFSVIADIKNISRQVVTKGPAELLLCLVDLGLHG